MCDVCMEIFFMLGGLSVICLIPTTNKYWYYKPRLPRLKPRMTSVLSHATVRTLRILFSFSS